MGLADALTGAANAHKRIAQSFIHGSEKTLSITVVSSGIIASSGASMFADLDDTIVDSGVGPFYCLWEDADSARVSDNSRESMILARYVEAEVVVKMWLEDILLDTTKPYGETYLDRARDITSEGLKYKILGYDRYGLGVTNPYIVAVALKGSFGYE